MIKALAISDIHLNQSRRLDDVSSALDRVVDLATEREVDKIFVLGDFFTSRRPTSRELAIFEKWIQKLRERYFEVYLLRGNHDESPDGVHSYHSIEAFDLNKICVLENPSIIDNIFLGHILLLGAKLGKGGWENNTGLTAKQLIEKYPRCRGYILGDVHAPQELHENPLVAYCGSIEKVDFSERDDQKRAIYMEYDLDDPLSFKWESIPLKTRSMIQYDVEAKLAIESIVIRGESTRDAIVKVVVHGSPTEVKQVDESEIRRELSDAKELTVQYDIQKESVARDSEMRESIAPQQALKKYLEKLDLPQEEQLEILKLADGVMNDASA